MMYLKMYAYHLCRVQVSHLYFVYHPQCLKAGGWRTQGHGMTNLPLVPDLRHHLHILAKAPVAVVLKILKFKMSKAIRL